MCLFGLEIEFAKMRVYLWVFALRIGVWVEVFVCVCLSVCEFVSVCVCMLQCV